MSPTLETLELAAREWLQADPDPATRREVEDLLSRGDRLELQERFSGELAFGTAGLRGLLGGGPNRMNRAVVRRTTLALCRYLQAVVPEAARRGIVVGRDARRMSRELLEDTAGVIAAAGFPALVFDDIVPTPLVSHAVARLGAAAGVMITASHNPPAYNGYKVYWGNGAQIIPPHDRGIAAEIASVGPANAVPVASRAEAGSTWRTIPSTVLEGYFAEVRSNQLHPEVARTVSIAYTPLHGVGDRFAREAFSRCGFTRVETVPEQAVPDGAFPTVAFPNPEEPGAMDLVVALGSRMNADLALANDPDADRLAVALPTPAGPWRQLTGNEVGILLGHYVLTHRRPEKALVISTVVSSGQLGHLAAKLGARYQETLTGFKWIANRALELETAEGLEFAFGFEEALGYTVGTVARDKDGVGAAVAVAELAAVCKSQGRTLLDELDLIQRRYGVFTSAQKSLTLPGTEGAARIRAVMESLRSQPPTTVGPFAVLEIRDLKDSTRRVGGVRSPLSPALPSSDVLVLLLEGDARVIVRPSGTEPKVKFYFEARLDLAAGADLEQARAAAAEHLRQVQVAFVSSIGA